MVSDVLSVPFKRLLLKSIDLYTSGQQRYCFLTLKPLTDRTQGRCSVEDLPRQRQLAERVGKRTGQLVVGAKIQVTKVR